MSADGKLLWGVEVDSSVQSSPQLADIDGDGKPEITIGAGRTGQTYIVRRDGTIAGAIPFAAIWSNTVAVVPSTGAGTLALVTGGIHECVVAAKPGVGKTRPARSD